ncbi:MAG: GDP-L-fucose synthase, partial [Chlamydiia bacterium]|nr:GDP-L-fucose synthase [Chlamydiia bacterium]
FGSDVTIKSLASTVAEAVGFDGEIVYDTEKPDGVFSKLLNSQFIHSLGWRPEIDLKTGITKTYKEIESHLNSF